MRAVFSLLLLAWLGCSSEAEPSLFVDLRTDFVGGVDFDGVRIYVGEGDLRERYDHVFNPLVDYFRGARIATHGGDRGQYAIEIELLRDGAVLANRQADIIVGEGRTVATVVITRDCSGVECPGASDSPLDASCLGGRCVDPRCTPETPEFCPESPLCQGDSECMETGCLRAECVTGVCLTGPDNSRCGGGEICLSDGTCMPSMDAGMPDGGIDVGPSDAGPDSPDSGPGDSGPGDSGGRMDAGPSATTFCEETFEWNEGAAFRVVPGESIQAAIDAALPGDTIVLADGEWVGEPVRVDKRLRLRAENPGGAILSGMSAEPVDINDRSTHHSGVEVVGAAASGTRIEGLHVRWFLFSCFRTEQTTDVTFVGNRAENCTGEGYHFIDVIRPRLFCSEALSPYTAGDPHYAATVPSAGSWTSYMTWGVRAEATIDARFTRNYLLGVTYAGFRVGVGSRDYFIARNTFNGFGVGIHAGFRHGSPLPEYPHTGITPGPDDGTIVLEENAFRPVFETRRGEELQYFARTPFNIDRIATGASLTVQNNTIEAADAAIRIDCDEDRPGPENCGTGDVIVRRNLFNGRLQHEGSEYQLSDTLMYMTPESTTQVSVEHLTFANSRVAVLLLRSLELRRSEFFEIERPFNGPASAVESNAFSPPHSLPGTANTSEDSLLPGELPELREARVATSPDHETARALFRPAPGSPARRPGYVRGGVE